MGDKPSERVGWTWGNMWNVSSESIRARKSLGNYSQNFVQPTDEFRPTLGRLMNIPEKVSSDSCNDVLEMEWFWRSKWNKRKW